MRATAGSYDASYQALPETPLPRASHLYGLVPRRSVLGNVTVPREAARSARSRQFRADAKQEESAGHGDDLRTRAPIRDVGRILRGKRSYRRSRIPAKFKAERGSERMRVADYQPTRGGRYQNQRPRGLCSRKNGIWHSDRTQARSFDDRHPDLRNRRSQRYDSVPRFLT